jgi:predicted NBD/HSP70 family sugar kinase
MQLIAKHSSTAIGLRLRTGKPRRHGVRKNTPVEQLRVKHRMEVILALRDHGALSRVELCQQIKRSSTTITKVIAELRDLAWVAELDTAPILSGSGELGRPRTALWLNTNACRVLAFVIEPHAIHWAVIGLDLEPIAIHSLACPVQQQNPQTTLQMLLQLVATQNLASKNLNTLAIALPGATDTQLRISLHSHQLGWSNLDLATLLEKEAKMPVVVHNNTRAMAFAEFRHLKLHENEPMLFVQARYGLGAAMLNSATPSPHGHYGVSELGYIPLGLNQFSDRVATDANLVSVTNEGYLRQVLEFEDPKLCVVRELERRLDAGDQTAALLFNQTLDNLAIALGIAVNLLNPQVIVLGGIYADASDAFLAQLVLRVASKGQPALTQDLRIQRSQLGLKGALQGAALVAFDRLLQTASTYQKARVIL